MILQKRGDDVFSKKKMLCVLVISFLISIIFLITFFNLLAEEPQSENFGAVILLILVFVLANIGAYQFSARSINYFSLGYFLLLLVCLAFGFFISATDTDYNVFMALLGILISPFYGLIYVSEHWHYVALAISVAMIALSAVLGFKRKMEK